MAAAAKGDEGARNVETPLPRPGDVVGNKAGGRSAVHAGPIPALHVEGKLTPPLCAQGFAASPMRPRPTHGPGLTVGECLSLRKARRNRLASPRRLSSARKAPYPLASRTPALAPFAGFRLACGPCPRRLSEWPPCLPSSIGPGTPPARAPSRLESSRRGCRRGRHRLGSPPATKSSRRVDRTLTRVRFPPPPLQVSSQESIATGFAGP